MASKSTNHDTDSIGPQLAQPKVPKRSANTPFRLWCQENRSEFTRKFPFHDERQIEEKMKNCWRRHVSVEEKKVYENQRNRNLEKESKERHQNYVQKYKIWSEVRESTTNSSSSEELKNLNTSSAKLMDASEMESCIIKNRIHLNPYTIWCYRKMLQLQATNHDITLLAVVGSSWIEWQQMSVVDKKPFYEEFERIVPKKEKPPPPDCFIAPELPKKLQPVPIDSSTGHVLYPVKKDNRFTAVNPDQHLQRQKQKAGTTFGDGRNPTILMKPESMRVIPIQHVEFDFRQRSSAGEPTHRTVKCAPNLNTSYGEDFDLIDWEPHDEQTTTIVKDDAEHAIRNLTQETQRVEESFIVGNQSPLLLDKQEPQQSYLERVYPDLMQSSTQDNVFFDADPFSSRNLQEEEKEYSKELDAEIMMQKLIDETGEDDLFDFPTENCTVEDVSNLNTSFGQDFDLIDYRSHAEQQATLTNSEAEHAIKNFEDDTQRVEEILTVGNQSPLLLDKQEPQQSYLERIYPDLLQSSTQDNVFFDADPFSSRNQKEEENEYSRTLDAESMLQKLIDETPEDDSFDYTDF